jgi:hypothetical protein
VSEVKPKPRRRRSIKSTTTKSTLKSKPSLFNRMLESLTPQKKSASTLRTPFKNSTSANVEVQQSSNDLSPLSPSKKRRRDTLSSSSDTKRRRNDNKENQDNNNNEETIEDIKKSNPTSLKDIKTKTAEYSSPSVAAAKKATPKIKKRAVELEELYSSPTPKRQMISTVR